MSADSAPAPASGKTRPALAAYGLLALITSALCLLLWSQRERSALLERLDRMTLDAQLLWRGPVAPSQDLVLVVLDDRSLRRLGTISRDRFRLAEAIDKLKAGGARLIALDLLLLEPARRGAGTDAESDQALAEAMARAGNVLIPFALPDEGATPASAEAGAVPVPRGVLASAFTRYGDAAGMQAVALRPTQMEAPPAVLADRAAALGHVTVPRSVDGAVRYDMPALELDGEVYPSLAVSIAAQALGLDWGQAEMRFGQALRLGRLQVPVDARSRQWVNYYGAAGRFGQFSFIDLLDGKVEASQLQGRIAIVGATALGAGDNYPTPFDGGLPGVERLANVVDNIMSERSLRRPLWAAGAELVAMLVLPLLACGLVARARLAWAFTALGLLALSLAVLLHWLFVTQLVFFSAAFPALALALAWLGATALRSLAEQRRRRAALLALKISEERYALAASGANDGLWDWDIAADKFYFSPRWIALMGLDTGQAHGMQAWTRVLDARAREEFDAELKTHLDGRSLQFHHVLQFHQGGQRRWLLARGVATRQRGRPVRMAGSLTDISEQQHLQHQLRFNALHDRLTGLPNRTLFRERLGQLLAADGDAHQVGMLLLGLDEFRAFNESHGTQAGDAVLREIARRLSVREGRALDVARLGPDEFGIAFRTALAPGSAEAAPAAPAAPAERAEPAKPAAPADLPRWALAQMQPGFDPDQSGEGHPLRLSACLGWADVSQGPGTADELLAAAEGALARAKSQGPGHLHAFDAAEQLVEHSRRWVKEHIDLALLTNDQFQLYYQPFVRLADRRLIGFEALIRWRHPQRGLVMPDDFIPVAEASGQIVAIGRWTLLEAAAQLRKWHALGFSGEISVNVSGVQLERDLELMRDARATLAALGDVPAHQLKLEVTESIAMANPQKSAEVLQELARMGFKVSIDDFGTGYSSLAYLHRFPFDTLKVDRSFVMRLGAGREAQEIVRTIVGLALALGKQTLAEGVEDEAQATLLEELGVQVAQGWLFARAMPAEAAEELIAKSPWVRPVSGRRAPVIAR